MVVLDKRVGELGVVSWRGGGRRGEGGERRKEVREEEGNKRWQQGDEGEGKYWKGTRKGKRDEERRVNIQTGTLSTSA